MSDHYSKIRKLQELVDSTSDRLVGGRLSLSEAEELMRTTRAQAELLIPDDMEKYDMIYASRFRRLIDQYVSADDTR